MNNDLESRKHHNGPAFSTRTLAATMVGLLAVGHFPNEVSAWAKVSDDNTFVAAAAQGSSVSSSSSSSTNNNNNNNVETQQQQQQQQQQIITTTTKNKEEALLPVLKKQILLEELKATEREKKALEESLKKTKEVAQKGAEAVKEAKRAREEREEREQAEREKQEEEGKAKSKWPLPAISFADPLQHAQAKTTTTTQGQQNKPIRQEDVLQKATEVLSADEHAQKIVDRVVENAKKKAEVVAKKVLEEATMKADSIVQNALETSVNFKNNNGSKEQPRQQQQPQSSVEEEQNQKSFWPSNDNKMDAGKEEVVVANNKYTDAPRKKVERVVEDERDNMAKDGEGPQIIDDDDLEEVEVTKVEKEVNPWISHEKASLENEEQTSNASVKRITHKKPDGSIDYDYPRVHDKPRLDKKETELLGSAEKNPAAKHPAFSHPEQFKSALTSCFRQSPEGDCTDSYFGHITEWDTSQIKNMAGAFMYKREFNQDLSKWDVSQVTNMKHMFYEAQSFDQDLSQWNTKNVEDMTGMFYAALDFNQNIGNWDVSRVKDMSYMFKHAQSFNFDLSLWEGPAVQAEANEIFEDAQSFLSSFSCPGMSVNGPVNACNWFRAGVDECLAEAPVDGQCHDYAKKSRRGTMPNWDTSQVRRMEDLFKNRANFNADITKWDTSNVLSMGHMFEGASSFNQPIGNWDTSKVMDMSNMFQKATHFNSNIINWDVSQVTSMRSMFSDAVDYNQPLERWNVNKVKDMFYMFARAKSFEQPIHTWRGIAADAIQKGEWGRIFEGAWAFNSKYSCRDKEGAINVGPVSTCVPKESAPKPSLAIPTLGSAQEKPSIFSLLPALGQHKSSSIDIPMDVSDHSKKFTPKSGVVNNLASEQSVSPRVTESSDGAKAEKEREAILRKIEKLNKKTSSKKHGKIIVHHDDGDYDEYEHAPQEKSKGIFANLFGRWGSSSTSSDIDSTSSTASSSDTSDDYSDVLVERKELSFKEKNSMKKSKKGAAEEENDEEIAFMGALDTEEEINTSSYQTLGLVCLTVCVLAVLVEAAQKYGPKFNHGITFDPDAPFFRDASSNGKQAFGSVQGISVYGAASGVASSEDLSKNGRDIEGGMVENSRTSKKFSVRSLIGK
jgi:surface protein